MSSSSASLSTNTRSSGQTSSTSLSVIVSKEFMDCSRDSSLAYRLPFKGALIRGDALIRINTVCVFAFTRNYNTLKYIFEDGNHSPVSVCSY